MSEGSSSFEVDEWDGVSSFKQHAVAGSIAGLAEHSVMFPLDTIKTLTQARQVPRWHAMAIGGQAFGGGGGSSLGALASFTGSHGVWGAPRLWRGVQTMFSGCIPAHAAYFSIYEGSKAALSSKPTGAAVGGAAAGAAASAAAEGEGEASSSDALAAGVSVALATMVHDVIMTPMDCIKQRLQLGHHKNSVFECACSMMKHEGPKAFLLSYPTTLLMNVPYALIMGSSNEAIRDVINPSGAHSVASYLMAGAGAGMLAAAATNPLDVIKTRLQTQHLRLASDTVTPAVSEAAAACSHTPLAYKGMLDTLLQVWRQEGMHGFSRGMGTRMLIHAPSVAICWTTYESAKHMMSRLHLLE